MQWASGLAIYFLFWFLSLFIVLPFGVRTDSEVGVESTPGHAESAPHRFRIGKVALRTTIVSAVLFSIFYANLIYGWVGTDFLDFFKPDDIRG